MDNFALNPQASNHLSYKKAYARVRSRPLVFQQMLAEMSVTVESCQNNPLIHFSIDVQSPESMLEKLVSNESDIGVGYFGSFPPLLSLIA